MEYKTTITHLIEESIASDKFDYISIIKMCHEKKLLDESLYGIYFTAGLNKSFYWDTNLVLKFHDYFGIDSKEAGKIYADIFLLHLNNYIQENSKKSINYSDSITDLNNKLYSSLETGIILPDSFLSNTNIKLILDIDVNEDYKEINSSNLAKFLRSSIHKNNIEQTVQKI